MCSGHGMFCAREATLELETQWKGSCQCKPLQEGTFWSLGDRLPSMTSRDAGENSDTVFSSLMPALFLDTGLAQLLGSLPPLFIYSSELLPPALLFPGEIKLTSFSSGASPVPPLHTRAQNSCLCELLRQARHLSTELKS